MRALVETNGNVSPQRLEHSLLTLGVDVVAFDPVTFNGYQEASKETAKEMADPDVDSRFDHHVTSMFLALALNGESGELGEKIKKYVREDDDEYLEEAQDELGDILWYWAQMATLLNVEADDVAERNLDKLLDREDRGVIMGQGDNR